MGAEAAARPTLVPVLVQLAADALQPPSALPITCGYKPLALLSAICGHAADTHDSALLQQFVATPGLMAVLAAALRAEHDNHPAGCSLVRMAALVVNFAANPGSAVAVDALCAEPRLLENLALVAHGPRAPGAARRAVEVGREGPEVQHAAEALEVLCASCGLDPLSWYGDALGGAGNGSSSAPNGSRAGSGSAAAAGGRRFQARTARSHRRRPGHHQL